MQASFSDLEYASKNPKGRGAGRPPIGLERMLRMVVA